MPIPPRPVIQSQRLFSAEQLHWFLGALLFHFSNTCPGKGAALFQQKCSEKFELRPKRAAGGPKGLLFTYSSNETGKGMVFFDNLVVPHYTGPLTEETNYYPLGMVQQGISSMAFGRADNKKKYNGSEANKTLALTLI